MTEHPISVRLDSKAIERLDRIAEALTARAAGATLTRSNVVRVAVDRGMLALETEFGLTKKKKR